MIPITLRSFSRWGFVDGRARAPMMIRSSASHGVVYAIAYALGRLLPERGA